MITLNPIHIYGIECRALQRMDNDPGGMEAEGKVDEETAQEQTHRYIHTYILYHIFPSFNHYILCCIMLL